jgi:hypothetical protein
VVSGCEGGGRHHHFHACWIGGSRRQRQGAPLSLGGRSSPPEGRSGGFAGFYCPPAGRGGQADHTAVPGHSPGGSTGRVGFGALHTGRSHSIDHAGAAGHAPNIGAIAAEGLAQPSVVGE